MIPYPNISPEIFRIGPLAVRWYGVMYLVGFILAYLLIPKQKRAQSVGLKGDLLGDFIFWLAIGLIVGARIGEILFYQYKHLDYYLKNPLEIIAFWHGGMSFHGGLIGTVIAGYIFSRKRNIPFTILADSVAVVAPLGLFFGRIGNFINGELYGRVSDVPWAMIFPAGGNLPRHPSQLYEALGEGLILFVIMWTLQKRMPPPGVLIGVFIGGYGFIRFFLEFFREPDPLTGFVFGFLTMGQILCALMIIAGTLIVSYCGFYRRRKSKNGR